MAGDRMSRLSHRGAMPFRDEGYFVTQQPAFACIGEALSSCPKTPESNRGLCCRALWRGDEAWPSQVRR